MQTLLVLLRANPKASEGTATFHLTRLSCPTTPLEHSEVTTEKCKEINKLMTTY